MGRVTWPGHWSLLYLGQNIFSSLSFLSGEGHLSCCPVPQDLTSPISPNMFCFQIRLFRNKKRNFESDQINLSKSQNFYFSKESIESLPKLDSYERIYNWLSHTDNEDQNTCYSEDSDLASNFNISEESYETEIRSRSKMFLPHKLNLSHKSCQTKQKTKHYSNYLTSTTLV